jgi:eukaryotic-like serine/threonine-protein kinase
VYAQAASLWRVPIMGGVPTLVAKPDPEHGDGLGFTNPEFLPTGRAVLYTSALAGVRLSVLDLVSGERKRLLDEAGAAQYAPSGHLVYRGGRGMRAIKFDLQRLETMGEPVPLPDPILVTTFGNNPQFDVALNGTMVFVPADAPVAARRIVWVGRDGREQPSSLPVRSYTYAAISPDGKHAALDIRDQENDIWIWDITGNTLKRLTFGPAFEQTPRWTADGRQVLFTLGAGIMAQRVDGTGRSEPVVTNTSGGALLNSLSPDGAGVVFRGSTLETGHDVKVGTLSDRSTQGLIETRANELNAEISPDGRWIAYESDESGLYEIYVRTFPDVSAGRWQLSSGGGRKALWNRNGRELFFVSASGAIMAVPIEKSATFSAGVPVQLFRGDYYFGGASSIGRTYDVSPDGQRFLMIKEDRSRLTSLSVVLNWTEELKRLAPAPD